MRIKRFEKAVGFRVFNRMAQVILFAAACLMIFFLAWKRFGVVDITREGRYSLTPETVAYLRALPQEVEVIGSLALGEDGSLGRDRLHELQNLTARYASVSQKLKVKWVDGYRAQTEYGFKSPYRILLRNGDRQEWVSPEELYLPQEDVFLGERALTSGLWRLENPTKRSVVAIVSRERWAADGAWGFKRLEEFLGVHNVEVKVVEPSEVAGEVLQADVVFVLGGSDALTTEALANLQRTINDHKGNVFIAIDELADEALVRFLYFNGLNWPSVRVEETDPRQKTPMGEMLIRDFEEHIITQGLRRNEQAVLSRGHWWALESRPAMVDVTAWPLFKSSVQSKAEGGTQRGPFLLMVALERKSNDATPARLLVAGSSDWLSNAYLSYRGNQTLLESSFDWVLGNNNLLSIPPRVRQARQLGLNSGQLWRMGGWILSGCLVLLAVGIVRWGTRPR